MRLKLLNAATLVLAVLAACGPETTQTLPPPKPLIPTEAPPIAPEPAKPEPKVIRLTSASPQALAAFEQASQLADQARYGQAFDLYRQATALDADFAAARAFYGANLAGAAGDEELTLALDLAHNRHETEELLVEMLFYQRRSDLEKAGSAATRLSLAAREDKRAHTFAGQFAYETGDFDNAAKHLSNALAIDPRHGPALNLMAYLNNRMGKADQAVAFAKRYAEAYPDEPNAHDTYGEILMNAAKLPEAEASFLKATELAPTFTYAWLALAQLRAQRGDAKGASAALAQAKLQATVPTEVLVAQTTPAWVALAQGNAAGAAAAFDAADKVIAAQYPSLAPLVTLQRAWMAYLRAKPADAVRLAQAAVDQSAAPQVGDPLAAAVKRWAGTVTVLGLARQGQAAEAERVLGVAEADAAKAPFESMLTSRLTHAKGMVLAAGGKVDAGIATLETCAKTDFACLWDRVQLLQQKSGKVASQAARQRLMDRTDRDPTYPFVRKLASGR
jgi:Flp pilus assembly protein TadD